MKNTLQLLATLFIIQSCSFITGPEGMFPETKYDFLDEEVAPNLSIPGYPVQVVYLIDLPNQSSYGQYDIVVNIGDETQTTMDLAGNYEDTLELIYRDI